MSAVAPLLDPIAGVATLAVPSPGDALAPAVLAAEAAGESSVGTVRAAVVTALIVVGSFFLFVGTFGLIRLPNVYNRMHATSKAATLGAASVLLAGAVYFGPRGEGLTSLVGIAFLFVTAPTGAHMISRAAQKMGIPFVEDATWPGLSGNVPEEPAEGEPEE
jgi:multicomponent Na+:H+ antiporter subunit G